MIKDGYYYPNWIWQHKLDIDTNGNYTGDAVFLFIEGNRRAGKSVGVGIYSLKDYFERGYKTALVRRYLKDFEDKKKPAMENFWSKAWGICLQHGYIEGLENHDISYEGHNCFIDGNLFSYPIALNLYNDYKNVDFDNVHTIIYDEFVTEQGTRLNDEVTAMYNVYDTVARGRDDALQTTSVIFISNVIDKANDFHAELEIDRELRPDTKRLSRPQKSYCVEIVNNEIAADNMERSPIGQLMRSGRNGRNYLGYSQGNKWKNNDDYITTKMGGSNYYCHNLTYCGKSYAVKFYNQQGKYYFTDKDVDETYPLNYALTKDDHTLNTTLITGLLKNSLRKYKNYYACGLLWFNSQRAKKIFLEIFKYL